MPATAPKLRFPEFRDQWQVKKLGDLASITTGKLDANAMTANGNYRFYTCAKEYYQIDEFAFDTEALLISGNGANVGYIHYYKGKFNAYQRTYVLDKFHENIFFIKLALDRNLGKRINLEKKEGNTPYIVLSTLSKMGIFAPTISEQQKIADFLTAVDEKIELMRQKVELLKKYKKGVMQKIFSQQIRFKDEEGKDSPEWEVKELGGIGKVTTGKTPPTNNKELWDGDVLFVTPTDMNGGKYQTTAERTVRINSESVLPNNSIMYTCIASIGKMSISTKPSITNQQINSLIPDKSHEIEYVYYALLWKTPQIKAESGNGLSIINKTQFAKISIPIPSIAEQYKIADFLTSIDDKIELEEKKLEQVKLFKKSLLQQMFV